MFIIMIIIFQMRKLKANSWKQIVQDHITSKKSQDLKPNLQFLNSGLGSVNFIIQLLLIKFLRTSFA